MGSHGSKMANKQDKLISALLTTRTIEQAAKKAGVGENTVYRWLELPEFQTAYREAKRKVVDNAIMQLQKATGEAVEVLREVMSDNESPANARVASAKAIIEQALRAVELEKVIERVEKLEEYVNKKGVG
jgi:phage terminase small subunit